MAQGMERYPLAYVPDMQVPDVQVSLGASKAPKIEYLGEIGEAPATVAPTTQNSGIGGDSWTDVKRGVQQIPGAVTGLLDIPFALTINERPISEGWETIGGMTKFQPGKWAKAAEAEYTPERKAQMDAVSKAWDATGGSELSRVLFDPSRWNELPTQWDRTDAAAVFQAIKDNPRATWGTVLQSLPSTVAGGGASLVARTLAKIPAAVAAGIGEGAITAGMAMDQIDRKVDPRKAAVASMGAGAVTGLIGGASGAMASRLGIPDIEMPMPKTGKAYPLYARVPVGAVKEGLFEEGLQSPQEQVWQNLAEGKPAGEGTLRAGVEGAIAGAALGGAYALRRPKPDVDQSDNAIPAADVGAGPGGGGGISGEYIPAAPMAPNRGLADQTPTGTTYDQGRTELPPGQTLLPLPALPAPEDGGPNERQVATARGLLNHSPNASPELLQRLMRVDQGMAVALFNHWQGQKNGEVTGNQGAKVPAEGSQGQGADDAGSGILDSQRDGAMPSAMGEPAGVAAPGGEPGMALGAAGPDAVALSAARPWDQANRNRRGDEWFEGARVNESSRAGFADALSNGGANLQAHGMGKERTLGGGIQNLLNMLSNGLDANRGGGLLQTAPLVSRPGEGLVGATASGSAYSDGPFMLVARPGESLTGNLSGLGAVLINQAHADIAPQIAAAIRAIRPDIIVAPYSEAGSVAKQLSSEKVSAGGTAIVTPIDVQAHGAATSPFNARPQPTSANQIPANLFSPTNQPTNQGEANGLQNQGQEAAQEVNGFIDGPNGYRTRISEHKAGSNFLDPTSDIGAIIYEVRKGENDPRPLNMVLGNDGKLVDASTVMDSSGKSNGTAWVPQTAVKRGQVIELLQQRAKTTALSQERRDLDAKIKEIVTGKVGAGGTALDAAAHQAATSPLNDLPHPTDAQKQAGNYAKGHVRFQGMDISIENPAGSVRSGKDEDGKAWETTMQHHYGYIKGTVGRDKDHLDVFIKPGAQTARTAYVIDQIDPKTGAFDEHKIVLGADSEQDARAIYQSNYQPGWNGLGAITAMPIDEFKAWIDSGKTKKPIAYVEPKGIAHPKPSAKPEAPAVIDPAAPYGKVDIAPFSSQVVGLKDNNDGTLTVMRGEEPFYDFENGDPVTVPTGATAEQIRQAVTDAGALSSRDKWFGVAKIGTKPAETGTGLDKSVTEPTKPPEQDPAAGADFLASNRAEFRHEGFRIYPISIKGEPRWAVQSLDNAEKEQKGERQIGGDAIVDTPEQAKQQAESQVTERAKKAERQREFAKQDAADEAKREANRGLSITERRANAALDKPTNLPVNAGVGRGSRREAMESAVSQGRAIVAADVPDTAAYKRDEDEQGRLHRAGYGAFFGNDSHPQKMRFNELTAKLKNRDNYQKKEYRLYSGRDTEGSFYEITKTEYDYAKSLMANGGNAKPVAAIAGKPVADMSDDQLRTIARGLSPTFGEAAVDKAKTEINRRNAALREEKAAGEGKPVATKEPDADTPFDSEAFDKSRDDRVKASKEVGNKHLDQVAPSVETMRGKEIYYAHNPQQRGVIRTVDNRGNVYVYWADRYSADKELASETVEDNKAWLNASKNLPYLRTVRDGKTYVLQSSLGTSDLKDYVFADGARPVPATQGKGSAASSPSEAEKEKKVGAGDTATKESGSQFSSLEKELAAKTHDTESNGDVGVVVGGGKVKYAALGDAVDAAKKAIASGTKANPFQIHNATGIRLGDVARVLAEAEKVGAGDTATAEKSSVAEKSAQQIEDFGEKIGGARKDVWSGFKDQIGEIPDDEIASQPFSKVWPAPDYQAMLDSGADPWSVAFMHAARDEVPAKPRAPYKVKRWAESVKLLRGMTTKILSGEYSVETVREKLSEQKNGLQKLASRVELYELVGHSKSLEGISFARHHYSIYRGREDVTLWAVEKAAKATAWSNWPTELATGDTKEEMLAAFKAKHAELNSEKAKSKEASFDIYSQGGEYFVGKKIGRNIMQLAGPFKTVKEARDHRTTHQEELSATLEKRKEIPQERRDTNNPRVGEDMRGGQDVTPQMFGEAFGFRGVEFGNWVEQGKRQSDLNEAYDALMDMAAILGVPPKALSLNGQLGLAFGARGTGGIQPAKAHYESDKVVINLTKKEGAGSLGHEWWHALDNYFSRIRAKNAEFMTEALDVSLASRDSKFIANTAVRKEMVAAFGKVIRAINGTALKARASKLDSKRTKEYWTTGIEMSARAFESYLISKLQDQNASNDYLANIVDEKTWKAAEALGFELDDSYPYPTAGEVPAIREAFDNFFRTVETKETDSGVAMFNAKSGSRGNPLDTAALEATIARVIAGSPSYFSRDTVVTASLFADLPAPILAKAKKEGYDANGRKPNGEKLTGATYDGKVYLVQENISSELEAEETLLHERIHQIVHGNAKDPDGIALRQSLGKLYTRAGAKSGIERMAKEAGIDMAGPLAAFEKVAAVNRHAFLAEEFLAHAEGQRAYEKLPAKIKRAAHEFWGEFRDWLRGSRFVRIAEALGARLGDFTQADLAWTLKGIRQQEAGTGSKAIRFMTAWHGSPHDHDGFDSSKIGTGEGAQAYGWGHYFASAREVAEHYRRSIRNNHEGLTEIGVKAGLSQPGARALADAYQQNMKFEDFERIANTPSPIPAIEAFRQDLRDTMDAAYNAYSEFKKPGKLYQVELAPTEDELLDWDKPLSEQSEKVKAALIKAYTNDHTPEAMARKYIEAEKGQTGEDVYREMQNKRFADDFGEGSAEQASKYLNSLGIRGIKYLDGSSRNRPLKEIKAEFLAELPEDADTSEVMELVGTGRFSPKNEALIKALADDDWLGFDYPAQAISAALGNSLSNYDASPALLQAVSDAKDGGTHNYVIFSDADVKITAKESRGTAQGGAASPSVKAIQDVVSRFKSEFKGAAALDIRVVGSASEIPARYRPSPYAEGVFHDDAGLIYLVAGNLKHANGQVNTGRVWQVLLHECVGHFGLAKMMGSRFGGILKEVMRAARAKGAVGEDIYEPGHPDYATIEAVRLRYPKASDEELAQEVLARMAETDPGRTLFGYVRAVVRQWLRDMARAAGITLDVTTAELNDLVAQASRYMRRGDGVSKGVDVDALGVADMAVGGMASKATGMESRAAPKPQGPIWSAPESSRADDLIYTMQDKNVDLKRVQQGITKALGDIRDDVDAYLQEELFHGRAAKATEEFLERELQPFVGEMKQRGIDMDTLETFLWARHAKERNAQIAKINPAMPDGGSGLTDKQAADILAGKDVTTGGQTVKGVPQAKLRSLKDLAVKVDRMVAGNRILTETYELETPDTVAAWKGAYQHYVPLHREDADTPWAGNGTGQGYSVKGSSTKRATGSFRPVENILANIVLQRTRTITRGEKNRVAQALYGLAKESPNEGFWDTDNAPTIRTVENKATIYHVMDGKTEVANFTRMADAEKKARENPAWFMYQDWGDRVVEKIDPAFRSKPNVVWARFGGEDRFVIFNERDERAMRLAGSLKNLDADDISHLLGEVSRWTRYFASVNTQYNPVFGVINLIRDTGTGLLNLKSTPLDGKQAQLLGNVWQALPAIYKAVRTDRKGGTPTGAWADLWEEFQEVGGKTGYRDMFKNSHEQREALEMALDPTWWQSKWWGKALTIGGVLSVPEQLFVDKIGKPVFQWLSDYNTMMENGIRLSAYKLALDQGMSKGRAASLAKNLTVNFNKKGQVARQAGALYAFFNASVQGTARMAETLHHGAKPGELLGAAGKQIVYGGMLLGAMQAMLLMMAGYDDDEPPEFVRDRNIIIPAGSGKYLTVPLPLGFHVLPAIGRIGTEFVLGGFKKPGKHVAHVFDVLADSFNPIGNAGLSMQTLAPTVLDPAAALAENKDWTGKPIYRENMSGIDQKPGHARTKDTATGLSKGLAYLINAASGGTEFKPGMLSPTPDQIDYLIGQITGGVGRETSKTFQTVSAAFTGEDLPTYKIPLVGRFYGDTKGQAAVSGKFYENLKTMNEHQAEFMGLAKSNRGKEAQEYAKENPEAMMFREGDRLQRYISRLRDQKRTMLAKGEPREKIKAVDDQITKTMQGFNQRVDLKKTPQHGMSRVEAN